MLSIEELMVLAKARGASDIHLVCGLPPKGRINGDLEDLVQDALTYDDCMDTARYLAGNRFNELMEVGQIDFSMTIDDSRCRLHLFLQQGLPSLALRILAEKIPEITTLGLPNVALNLVNLKKGIVLVTGVTGSGKSTTLASMINTINHLRKCHIVTLEDPVEYRYDSAKAVINQREVGRDVRSFSEGLRAAMREDPDVILIGEMRDRETIETAITAAETGHLVFATLHTVSAADSVDRMIQVFPSHMQDQARLELSMVLQAVLSQQLVRGRMGGRVLACETMIVTDAIRNMIRDGNTPQIRNAISTSAAEGGQSMDQALLRLVDDRKITKELAIENAMNPAYIRKNAY